MRTTQFCPKQCVLWISLCLNALGQNIAAANCFAITMRMFSEGDGCNCYIHATETFTHFAPELVMIADDFLIAHKENER